MVLVLVAVKVAELVLVGVVVEITILYHVLAANEQPPFRLCPYTGKAAES